MSSWPTPWTRRIWQEFHAGNLTRAARDVLLTLHTYSRDGSPAWPSQVTLGDRAQCTARTVRRALERARDLGLVSWTERRVKAGWRWLRTSNLYRLLLPAEPVVASPRTTGHWVRRGERKKNNQAQEQGERAGPRSPLRSIEAQLAGLPAVTAEMHAACAARWQAMGLA